MDSLDRHIFYDHHQSVPRERNDVREVDGYTVLRHTLGHLYVDHARVRDRREVHHAASVAGALQAFEREDRAEGVVGRQAAGRDRDVGRENSPLDALRRSRSL